MKIQQTDITAHGGRLCMVEHLAPKPDKHIIETLKEKLDNRLHGTDVKYNRNFNMLYITMPFNHYELSALLSYKEMLEGILQETYNSIT